MKDWISSFSMLTFVFVFSLIFTSCAGAPTKKASTPSRTYEAFPSDVYDASIRAFQNLGLEIFKEDREIGYVEGGRKPGFGRGAETVGVFIETVSPSETIVKIDNKKAIWGRLFAVDWTEKLFSQIGSELER